MNGIELKMSGNGSGAFVIEESGKRIAEMQVSVDGKNLIVHHTEVDDKLKGQGVASQLLDRMVDYARQNKLQVVPRCAYVNVQFKRRPERYRDVWKG